jgi:hypothetical protein
LAEVNTGIRNLGCCSNGSNSHWSYPALYICEQLGCDKGQEGMSFYPALQQNHLRSGRCQTNGWKEKRIFSLMNVSVKENPFLERDFSGTMQNSAYDLQSCARDATIYKTLQKIS